MYIVNCIPYIYYYFNILDAQEKYVWYAKLIQGGIG